MVRTAVKQHFIISIQYEYSFWEMTYTLEQWSVNKEAKKVIG
ncbi:TenA family transcriptional regulator [Bacillus paranthracis]